jgi:murein DD-endopeptidase MepM/ murein hydrolase activator NlpD
MYETDGESMIAVLLGSESIVDFLANIDMVKAIHESDTQLLKELETKLDEIEQKKADLEAVEEKLLVQKSELETHRSQVAAQRGELATARGRVQELRDAAIEDIERLEAESKRIQQELAARQSTWEYGGGAMSWPVSGTVTSEFGMRVNPISGKYALHAGIVIGVSTGTPVRAAADGIVINSGWNSGGYGNLVMIDNGSNIVTCYAHNSSLAVSVGQAVVRGEVIAYAGSTGNSTGPHCHFEVRVSGEPQNPRAWF